MPSAFDNQEDEVQQTYLDSSVEANFDSEESEILRSLEDDPSSVDEISEWTFTIS
jgi:hypothetical protein